MLPDVRFLRVLLIVGLVAVPSVAGAQTDDRRPTDFGPMPYFGDCRDSGGQVCVQDPWTGNLSVGPKVVREGESVTATFSLEPGGVSFTMGAGGECTQTKDVKEQEVQNAEGRWERKEVPVPTSSTCTFKPGPTNGRWTTYQVGVTGPCGSQIAVQEGRAEWASCAGTYASDYYGVIAKDDDRYGISGMVAMTNGRGLAGVPISVSGAESKSTTTGPGGGYYFLVKKGTYTVTAGAKVCAVPIAGAGCKASKTVSVGPSQTVNFRPPGEGVIKGTVFGAGSKPKGGVTVHVVGPDGTTAVTDDKGHYEARVPEGTYALSATGMTEGEKPEKVIYCADDHGTFPKQCRATVKVDVKPDHIVNWARKADPDDIQIEISGTETDKGQAFDATVKVTNPRKVDLSAVTFASAPAGIAVETILQYAGQPVVLATGPEPALPKTLAAGETVTLRYRFETPEAGEAVLSVNASGQTADGKTVPGTGAMSVTAGKPVTEEDMDRATINGVTNVLALAADHQERLDDMFAKKALADAGRSTDVEEFLGDRLGLPAEFAKLMQGKADEERAFWRGYGKAFSRETDKFGQEGGQFLANAWATLEDPVALREFATQMVDGAKKLGPAALENLGYLGQAILAKDTPEGMKEILRFNGEMLSNVTTALGEAWVGAGELNTQNAAAYKKDPVAYRESQGDMWGGASFTGVKEAALGALGEAGVRGVAAALPKLMEAVGINRLRGAGAGANETRATTDGIEGALGATDDLAAAQRRMDLAEAATKTTQELPYGTVLDEAGLATAGIRADDAKQIQSIIDDAKKEFGVDLEIGARTSEPLSAGIDGVAKREFIKPKAVSNLDQILGGEPSFAGRASVFEAHMPADDVLRGLEARNPGITAKLEARLADQKKLYKDFQDPNSALRTLADSSKLEAANGKLLYPDGVTAIVERPGYRLPSELGKLDGQSPFAYLEQLDEAAFLQSRGISPGRAAEIKAQLSKFPDQGRTRLLTETKNGTTTFIEGTVGKPIVSDLDLQFVRPKGGWPAGKRGQIEAFVNARMKKIDRFPQHGWSDAALDVPADYAEVAAKFVLNTTHPANAKAAAGELSRQFKTMAKQIRAKAAREADATVREKMLQQAANFEKLTPEELLKKYPPGEKIIVFSAGDIRVGSGTGGR